MLALQEFINQYTGQTNVGDTPENKGECVGLIEVWTDNLGLPHTWGNAIDLLIDADTNSFDVIYNTPINFPVAGDVIVFGKPYGQSTDVNGKIVYLGHTGVVVSADENSFIAFEQNNPIGSAPQLVTHNNYGGVIGWMHPKAIPQPTTEQQQDDPLVSDPKSVRDLLVTKASQYDDFVNAGYHTVDQINEKINQLEQDKQDADMKIGNLVSIIGATTGVLDGLIPAQDSPARPDITDTKNYTNMLVNAILDLKKNIKDDERYSAYLEEQLAAATAPLQSKLSEENKQVTTEQQQPPLEIESKGVTEEITTKATNFLSAKVIGFLHSIYGYVPSFGLGEEDKNRLFRGYIYTALGISLTYLEQWIPSVKFGIFAPMAMGINYMIVSFGHKLLDGVKQ